MWSVACLQELDASGAAFNIERGLFERLLRLYGERTKKVIGALASMGPRFYFRLNSTLGDRDGLLGEISSRLGPVLSDQKIIDAASFAVKERPLQSRGLKVVADRFAAEAVLQGAHLYARGVKKCSGINLGSEASVTDETGVLAGVGVARQSETGILSYRQGLAVEILENRFGLPSLRDTEWYWRGQIHPQSLPAIVTSHVLDPQPGELIVDMNCAPGGKMSHLCQLTGNKARVVGFDRNERKIAKARTQLERWGCTNYNLVAHDSRYVDVDYSLKPDRILVDPPCTGLGVTPKLSVETTAKDVEDLSGYQKQFLSSASRMAGPGARIVYSVCTITREECEDVAAYGTENLGLELEHADPMIGLKGRDSHGLTQRFDPDIHGSGFFIARFRKK